MEPYNYDMSLYENSLMKRKSETDLKIPNKKNKMNAPPKIEKQNGFDATNDDKVKYDHRGRDISAQEKRQNEIKWEKVKSRKTYKY